MRVTHCDLFPSLVSLKNSFKGMHCFPSVKTEMCPFQLANLNAKNLCNLSSNKAQSSVQLLGGFGIFFNKLDWLSTLFLVTFLFWLPLLYCQGQRCDINSFIWTAVKQPTSHEFDTEELYRNFKQLWIFFGFQTGCHWQL